MNFKMHIKKERILTTAQKIFARFGIQKTTMDEIAKMARIGKATLYYYFKSKEDIFAKVIQKESKILKQKLIDAVNKADTPQDKISNYMTTRIRQLRELSNYYTTITDEYLDYYSFVKKERRSFSQFEIDSIKCILNEGIEQGIFVIENIKTTARMIVIALNGLEISLRVENSDYNMNDEINQMLNIFFKGIEIR